MKIEVQVYTMHENGMNFIEIAKKLGISAKEAGRHWVKAEQAKERFASREKVVYRKRLTTNKSVHQQFAKKVKNEL